MAWLAAALAGTVGGTALAAPYPDRFVWVFGWDLSRETDVAAISNVLARAAQSGLNGAVLSAGFDTLCRQFPDYFKRLDEVQQTCDRLGLELMPSLFSVGYGSGALAHNRNLAEGVPVTEAPFVVSNGVARLMPDPEVRMRNGDFEEVTGNKFAGFRLQEQPGEVSFADQAVKHGGRSSIRLENFRSNPHGHGRLMQEVHLKPQRCYRVSFWVKTQGLRPPNAFRMLALAEGRELAPRTLAVPATCPWRKVSALVNSLDYERLNLYLGVWGATEGKFWVDDLSIEEVGPINVLRRPGTPVTVRSEDGATAYTEGKDFARLQDPELTLHRTDQEAMPLRPRPGGAIQEGQRLRVSWYHPMVIHEGQVTVCMGEPELYSIYDHEARLLAQKVHPKRVLLNMDEVRMGGTCRACRGRDMGELLGECITRQAEAVRRYLPKAEIYVWSDMLDPHHNAHGDYYLVKGNFTNSWKHIPKDLRIAVWGGKPRPESLRFFAEEGFETLVACYYDAADLSEVRDWLKLARATPKVRGLMYTPWQRKYTLLPDFGALLQQP